MGTTAIKKTQLINLESQSLLTRKHACDILHIGLSSLDTLQIYKELRRIKIGRHTFILKEDLLEFVLAHSTGGNQGFKRKFLIRLKKTLKGKASIMEKLFFQ